MEWGVDTLGGLRISRKTGNFNVISPEDTPVMPNAAKAKPANSPGKLNLNPLVRSEKVNEYRVPRIENTQ